MRRSVPQTYNATLHNLATRTTVHTYFPHPYVPSHVLCPRRVCRAGVTARIAKNGPKTAPTRPTWVGMALVMASARLSHTILATLGPNCSRYKNRLFGLLSDLGPRSRRSNQSRQRGRTRVRRAHAHGCYAYVDLGPRSDKRPKRRFL